MCNRGVNIALAWGAEVSRAGPAAQAPRELKTSFQKSGDQEV